MVSYFGESKLAPMLAKFGIPVVLTYLGADYAEKGIRDEVDADMLQADSGTFAGRVVAVLVETKAFPTGSLKAGQAFVVEGVEHTIISAFAQEDGAVTRVLCARA